MDHVQVVAHVAFHRRGTSKTMPNKIVIRKKINSRSNLATILVSFWFGSNAAIAGAFVDPPIFASANGLLDLLMIAKPVTIPSISFTPPQGGGVIHPTGGFMKSVRDQWQLATSPHHGQQLLRHTAARAWR